MRYKGFVEDIVTLDSCHGCGVCLPACPVPDCITMEKSSINVSEPKIDFNTCIECDKCVKVCSGIEFENNISNDYGVGEYINIYEGFALNDLLRKNSSSGGVVSSILTYLFDNNLIEAAIVADMEILGSHIDARGKVIYSSKEVQKYAKSIYSMVDMSEALNEVLKQKITYAVVGLPCHLESITKLLGKGKKAERCIVKIGLMDGKNVCSYALDYETRNKQVSKYEFRSKDWWNFKTLKVQNNASVFTKWSQSDFSLIWDNFIMIPRKCTVCNDFTAEYSDISVADAWLTKYQGNEIGHSLIVSRNDKAENILLIMKLKKLLHLENSDYTAIHESQYLQIDYKKRLFELKIYIYQIFYKKYKFVDVNYNKDNYNFNDKLAMFKHLFLNELSLILIQMKLHHLIPKTFLKLNKKFVYQPLICKVVFKLFKWNACKYNNFKGTK